MSPDVEFNEEVILNYFFTNKDKPIFAMKNMPPSLQNYMYVGVSRFPDMRKRFLKILKDKNILDDVAEIIKQNQPVDDVLENVIQFAAERNKDLYFNMKHGSSAEGASVFVVSEKNPIYATEIQQDFYFPKTTMEFSTRYAKRFDIDHVYWDPVLMNSEFADEIKSSFRRNFEIYKKGFDIIQQLIIERKEQGDLTTKVSTLDTIRFIIPTAAYTTIILGGNSRAVIEHFTKLLGSEDNFTKDYAQKSLEEFSKVIPGFFENLKPYQYVIERNKRLKDYAQSLFKGKFEPVKTDVQLFYEYPMEEVALTQILYPFCNVPFQEIYDTVSDFNDNERKEIFDLANLGRENRKNPIRGFETRHLIYEIESPFGLWKDFKRNRMNLRFHQDMRGLAGFYTPPLIKESSIAKEYEEAQKTTSDLVERVYQKFGGLSRAVASQGSNKRYLLTMGPRQLTVLGELRTIGEGDKGYRIIASKMISLAKERNPRLFNHIKDNYKGE
ncbi:MAG: FAD-dependent thymidylate synthase [Candidatus Aenigmatarchaeota archaeon]